MLLAGKLAHFKLESVMHSTTLLSTIWTCDPLEYMTRHLVNQIHHIVAHNYSTPSIGLHLSLYGAIDKWQLM